MDDLGYHNNPHAQYDDELRADAEISVKKSHLGVCVKG